MRGEALIYGRPAGCNFISASHCLVAGAAAVFFIILVACRRQAPGPANKNPSNGSVRCAELTFQNVLHATLLFIFYQKMFFLIKVFFFCCW